jgi:hypothetical protein
MRDEEGADLGLRGVAAALGDKRTTNSFDLFQSAPRPGETGWL